MSGDFTRRFRRDDDQDHISGNIVTASAGVAGVVFGIRGMGNARGDSMAKWLSKSIANSPVGDVARALGYGPALERIAAKGLNPAEAATKPVESMLSFPKSKEFFAPAARAKPDARMRDLVVDYVESAFDEYVNPHYMRPTMAHANAVSAASYEKFWDMFESMLSRRMGKTVRNRDSVTPKAVREAIDALWQERSAEVAQLLNEIVDETGNVLAARVESINPAVTAADLISVTDRLKSWDRVMRSKAMQASAGIARQDIVVAQQSGEFRTRVIYRAEEIFERMTGFRTKMTRDARHFKSLMHAYTTMVQAGREGIPEMITPVKATSPRLREAMIEAFRVAVAEAQGDLDAFVTHMANVEKKNGKPLHPDGVRREALHHKIRAHGDPWAMSGQREIAPRREIHRMNLNLGNLFKSHPTRGTFQALIRELDADPVQVKGGHARFREGWSALLKNQVLEADDRAIDGVFNFLQQVEDVITAESVKLNRSGIYVDHRNQLNRQILDVARLFVRDNYDRWFRGQKNSVVTNLQIAVERDEYGGLQLIITPERANGTALDTARIPLPDVDPRTGGMIVTGPGGIPSTVLGGRLLPIVGPYAGSDIFGHTRLIPYTTGIFDAAQTAWTRQLATGNSSMARRMNEAVSRELFGDRQANHAGAYLPLMMQALQNRTDDPWMRRRIESAQKGIKQYQLLRDVAINVKNGVESPTFVFFDIEGTTVDANTTRPTQVSAVKFRLKSDGTEEVVDKMLLVIDPEDVDFPTIAAELQGGGMTGDKMRKFARTHGTSIDGAKRFFQQFIDDAKYVVGYNLERYDVPALQWRGVDFQRHVIIDLMNISYTDPAVVFRIDRARQIDAVAEAEAGYRRLKGLGTVNNAIIRDHMNPGELTNANYKFWHTAVPTKSGALTPLQILGEMVKHMPGGGDLNTDVERLAQHMAITDAHQGMLLTTTLTQNALDHVARNKESIRHLQVMEAILKVYGGSQITGEDYQVIALMAMGHLPNMGDGEELSGALAREAFDPKTGRYKNGKVEELVRAMARANNGLSSDVFHGISLTQMAQFWQHSRRMLDGTDTLYQSPNSAMDGKILTQKTSLHADGNLGRTVRKNEAQGWTSFQAMIPHQRVDLFQSLRGDAGQKLRLVEQVRAFQGMSFNPRDVHALDAHNTLPGGLAGGVFLTYDEALAPGLTRMNDVMAKEALIFEEMASPLRLETRLLPTQNYNDAMEGTHAAVKEYFKHAADFLRQQKGIGKGMSDGEVIRQAKARDAVSWREAQAYARQQVWDGFASEAQHVKLHDQKSVTKRGSSLMRYLVQADAIIAHSLGGGMRGAIKSPIEGDAIINWADFDDQGNIVLRFSRVSSPERSAVKIVDGITKSVVEGGRTAPVYIGSMGGSRVALDTLFMRTAKNADPGALAQGFFGRALYWEHAAGRGSEASENVLNMLLRNVERVWEVKEVDYNAAEIRKFFDGTEVNELSAELQRANTFRTSLLKGAVSTIEEQGQIFSALANAQTGAPRHKASIAHILGERSPEDRKRIEEQLLSYYNDTDWRDIIAGSTKNEELKTFLSDRKNRFSSIEDLMRYRVPIVASVDGDGRVGISLFRATPIASSLHPLFSVFGDGPRPGLNNSQGIAFNMLDVRTSGSNLLRDVFRATVDDTSAARVLDWAHTATHGIDPARRDVTRLNLFEFRKGALAGGKATRQVWEIFNEFAGDPQRLAKTTIALNSAFDRGMLPLELQNQLIQGSAVAGALEEEVGAIAQGEDAARTISRRRARYMHADDFESVVRRLDDVGAGKKFTLRMPGVGEVMLDLGVAHENVRLAATMNGAYDHNLVVMSNRVNMTRTYAQRYLDLYNSYEAYQSKYAKKGVPLKSIDDIVRMAADNRDRLESDVEINAMMDTVNEMRALHDQIQAAARTSTSKEHIVDRLVGHVRLPGIQAPISYKPDTIENPHQPFGVVFYDPRSVAKNNRRAVMAGDLMLMKANPGIGRRTLFPVIALPMEGLGDRVSVDLQSMRFMYRDMDGDQIFLANLSSMMRMFGKDSKIAKRMENAWWSMYKESTEGMARVSKRMMAVNEALGALGDPEELLETYLKKYDWLRPRIDGDRTLRKKVLDHLVQFAAMTAHGDDKSVAFGGEVRKANELIRGHVGDRFMEDFGNFGELVTTLDSTSENMRRSINPNAYARRMGQAMDATVNDYFSNAVLENMNFVAVDQDIQWSRGDRMLVPHFLAADDNATDEMARRVRAAQTSVDTANHLTVVPHSMAELEHIRRHVAAEERVGALPNTGAAAASTAEYMAKTVGGKMQVGRATSSFHSFVSALGGQFDELAKACGVDGKLKEQVIQVLSHISNQESIEAIKHNPNEANILREFGVDPTILDEYAGRFKILQRDNVRDLVRAIGRTFEQMRLRPDASDFSESITAEVVGGVIAGLPRSAASRATPVAGETVASGVAASRRWFSGSRGARTAAMIAGLGYMLSPNRGLSAAEMPGRGGELYDGWGSGSFTEFGNPLFTPISDPYEIDYTSQVVRLTPEDRRREPGGQLYDPGLVDPSLASFVSRARDRVIDRRRGLSTLDGSVGRYVRREST